MIAVIGAGPAGSVAAYHLAKAGKEVHVFEEHKAIGLPVQCTGIVTSGIEDLASCRGSVMNRVRDVRVYSPDATAAEFTLRRPNLVLSRSAFDRSLAERARSAGATYHLGHKYLFHSGGTVKLLAGRKEKSFEAEAVIGADGPNSAVARCSGLFGRREFFLGVQATARCENDNAVEFTTGVGDFAWVVPESSERVRIGICARNDANAIFTSFLKKRLGRDYKKDILCMQSGLIPLYNPRVRTHLGNTYLVGDSALMVKATTAGGIIQGMLAAECLSDALISGESYEKAWRRRIGTDLLLHLAIRRLMDRFTDKDYNQLIRIFTRQENRRLLEEFDRDYPRKFLLRLALQEPRLLGFSRLLLRRSAVRKGIVAW